MRIKKNATIEEIEVLIAGMLNAVNCTDVDFELLQAIKASKKINTINSMMPEQEMFDGHAIKKLLLL